MDEFCSCAVPGRAESVVVWDRTDGRAEVVRWLCSECREPLRPVEDPPPYAPDPALIETPPSPLERLGHVVVAVVGGIGSIAAIIAVVALSVVAILCIGWLIAASVMAVMLG
jgi:hypothetical protein